MGLGRSASERRAVERLASRDASPVSWDPIGSVEDAEVWAVVRSLPGEQAAAESDEDEEEEAKGTTPGASQPAPPKQGRAEAAHPIWSLLSSHPDTVERAHALQQGQSPHCSAP